MITVFAVDSALRRVCAIFSAQADRGDITPTERDLLMDGAIMLAMHVDELARDSLAAPDPVWPQGAHSKPFGRHERQAVAVAA